MIFGTSYVEKNCQTGLMTDWGDFGWKHQIMKKLNPEFHVHLKALGSKKCIKFNVAIATSDQSVD